MDPSCGTVTAQQTGAPACRLCGSTSAQLFHTDKKRSYYRCSRCELVFVPVSFMISESAEKAEYDLHENNLEDEGYRRFLFRAIHPLVEALGQLHTGNHTDTEAEGQFCGLDFGCGPSPVLATVLSEEPYCYNVQYYDKYYYPQHATLLESENTFDFVTATEVAEHLENPLAEFHRIWKSVRSPGIVLIMTKRVFGTLEKFRNWHYTRDPTHITFFSETAFRWLATELETTSGKRCELRVAGPDVVLLLKSNKQ